MATGPQQCVQYTASRKSGDTGRSLTQLLSSASALSPSPSQLEYVLEDTQRARAFGHCLQAGVVELTKQVTTDDESHVPKTALDALQNEVTSADAYGLQAGAEQLAAAIGSDSIPVKLKALNVLVSAATHRHLLPRCRGAKLSFITTVAQVTIVPTACFSFAQYVLATCLAPCEEATRCSLVHPTRGDQPAAMVRESATRVMKM